ncbi:MAG: peptidoglycan-binding domain-containing protein [Tranquillimonas sp.]
MPPIFRTLLAALLLAAGLAAAAPAQDGRSWVQIEAQPSLAQARDRASAYAQRLEDVAGFRLGTSDWYAIALGPYDAASARRTRSDLRQRGLIPGDSFVTDGASFGRRFWPAGADARQTPPAADPAPQAATAPGAPPQAPAQAPSPAPVPADAAPAAAPQPAEPEPETPEAARRGEAALTGDERRELQRALRWAGVYSAGIDGDFGRGTRAAMAAWQRARNAPETGILTSGQRAALLDEYRQALAELGLDERRDERAGIALRLPLGLVSFTEYEPPFVHFDPVEDGAPYRVLLISQPGDAQTLAGLYDVMQTLEIVPPEGPRSRGADSFTLTGQDDRIVSQTEASLQDGEIKGFSLIWPAGDEARRQRVLTAMRDSFTRLPGVLPRDAGGVVADQRIDLLAGLQVRRPDLSRSGFYVGPDGAVLTAAATVAGCERVTLDGDRDARIAARDAAAGLALLMPAAPLAPRQVAQLAEGVPRLGSQVAVAGYSYQGVLGAPSLTYGTLADLRDLTGDAGMRRLDLQAQDGDVGGPVLGSDGTVLGLLLPHDADAGQVLPEGVSFAAAPDRIAAFLAAQGLTPPTAAGTAPLSPDAMSDRAAALTVLVGCWQ